MPSNTFPAPIRPTIIKYAEQAIDEFKKVLDTNPPKEQQIHSLKGIASLYFNMKKMDLAKRILREGRGRSIPTILKSYYSIAVIDWTQAYQPRLEARAKLGLKPTDDIKDKKTCADLLKAIKDRTRPWSKTVSPSCRSRLSCVPTTTTPWRT